jgi:hypothetical protein
MELLEERVAAVAAPRSLPEFVAVSVKRPESAKLEAARRKFRDRFRYLEGRLGESGHAFEERLGFGSFDRIIEDFGALHYAPFDRVLESYGRLLKEGGKLFFYMTRGTTFVDATGRPVSDETYLRSLGGLQVANFDSTYGIHQVELVRTGDPLSIPPLGETIKYFGPPPVREYVIGGRTAETKTFPLEAFPTYQIDGHEISGKIVGLAKTGYYDAAGSLQEIYLYTDSEGTTHVSVEFPFAQPNSGLIVFGDKLFLPPSPERSKYATYEKLPTPSGADLETMLAQYLGQLDRGFDRAPSEGLDHIMSRVAESSHLSDEAREP